MPQAAKDELRSPVVSLGVLIVADGRKHRSDSSSVMHLEFDHKFSNVFEQVRLRSSNAQDPLTPFPGQLTGFWRWMPTAPLKVCSELKPDRELPTVQSWLRLQNHQRGFKNLQCILRDAWGSMGDALGRP